MPNKLVLLAAALTMTAGGNAAPRMAGMAAVQGDAVDLRGIGWGQSGRFELAALDAQGSYRRSASKVGRGEVDYTGMVDFTLDRAGEDEPVEGRCQYHQGTSESRDRIGRSVRLETTVLDLPFTYACQFSRGGREIGTLALDRAPGAWIDVRTPRRGEVRLGATRLDLRSAHNFEGSKMPAEMPLGYLMATVDGDVGAAYLNGETRRLILPKVGEQREAALLASLALALLWDPGDGD